MKDVHWLFKEFFKGLILPIHERWGTTFVIFFNLWPGTILDIFWIYEDLSWPFELSLIIKLPRFRLLTLSILVLVFVGFSFVFVHFSYIRTCTYTNTETYILLAYLVSIWYFWSDFGSKNDVWISTHHKLCELSIKIINKNKFLKTKKKFLENEVYELKEKAKRLEKSKNDTTWKSCQQFKLEIEKLKITQDNLIKQNSKFKKFDQSICCADEIIKLQKIMLARILRYLI